MSRAKQATCPNCDCAYCKDRIECGECRTCGSYNTKGCKSFKREYTLGGISYVKNNRESTIR